MTEGDDERAPEKAHEAQSRLLHSEKLASLGMLIAGIAHEINTPIGAVRSMHETSARAVSKLREALERELPDYRSRPKLERMLTIIEDANRVASDGSARIIDIVRRVRSFARLDQTSLQTVQLEDGLEDTLTLVHHELKHSVKVHREFAPLPPVDCYPGRLNQVFLNLVMNARQAMGPGGEIFIRTFVDTGDACVEIRDTGTGIPHDNLPKIFEAGFTTKGDGVGTGLGLSIVKNIVDEHRGRIDVDSTMGVGTIFTVRIPLDLAERIAAEE
ncbi:MAG: ATP-binding protein, partial [Myxococcota bacterium]